VHTEQKVKKYERDMLTEGMIKLYAILTMHFQWCDLYSVERDEI